MEDVVKVVDVLTSTCWSNVWCGFLQESQMDGSGSMIPLQDHLVVDCQQQMGYTFRSAKLIPNGHQGISENDIADYCIPCPLWCETSTWRKRSK